MMTILWKYPRLWANLLFPGAKTQEIVSRVLGFADGHRDLRYFRAELSRLLPIVLSRDPWRLSRSLRRRIDQAAYEALGANANFVASHGEESPEALMLWVATLCSMDPDAGTDGVKSAFHGLGQYAVRCKNPVLVMLTLCLTYDAIAVFPWADFGGAVVAHVASSLSGGAPSLAETALRAKLVGSKDRALARQHLDLFRSGLGTHLNLFFEPLERTAVRTGAEIRLDPSQMEQEILRTLAALEPLLTNEGSA